jgi:DNA modification methylase
MAECLPVHCHGESADFDLILTSPPYPNNIDYSEVYKLELWLLGFIDKQANS